MDCFIAGAGTGGTLNGAGQYLKEKNPSCHVVSCLISGMCVAGTAVCMETLAASDGIALPKGSLAMASLRFTGSRFHE